MNATEFQVLLGSVGALLLILGGGSKWLLMHIGSLQATAALAQLESLGKLDSRLREEIHMLRQELLSMHSEKKFLLRRIYQLEAFIHSQPGIDLPIMEGWPPI